MWEIAPISARHQDDLALTVSERASLIGSAEVWFRSLDVICVLQNQRSRRVLFIVRRHHDERVRGGNLFDFKLLKRWRLHRFGVDTFTVVEH